MQRLKLGFTADIQYRHEAKVPESDEVQFF